MQREVEQKSSNRCMCCGSEKVSHDCKGDHFKKNLSEEGAVKEEPKPQTPNGEGREVQETTKSSA